MMHRDYLVRVGLFGQVGRFRAEHPVAYPHRAQVVCRTRRGVEVGHVLAPARATDREWNGEDGTPDGTLVRAMTAQDQLLLERMERGRRQAYQACDEYLRQHNVVAQLMDVEHLFDGSSLYFYFLGEVPSHVNELTAQLAETYDAEVKFRQFADAVNLGCGPDCGTEDGAGCGSSCDTCAVVKACGSKEARLRA